MNLPGEDTKGISKPRKEREGRENYNHHIQCNINSIPKLFMGSDLSMIKAIFGKSVKEKEIQIKQGSREQGPIGNVKRVDLIISGKNKQT